MSYREFNAADKADLNRRAYLRMCDRLGVKNFALLGFKNRKTTRYEDIVFHEVKERMIASIVSKPGRGKSVLAAQLGDWQHVCQNKPLLVNDRKSPHDYTTHMNPLQQERFSKQLTHFGFYPCAPPFVLFKPSFANFDDAAQPFCVAFRHIVELDSAVNEAVFSRFMNLASDTSPAYRDMVSELWTWLRSSPDVSIETALNQVESINYRRSKARMPVAGGFYSNLKTLENRKAIDWQATGLNTALAVNKALVILGTTEKDSKSWLFDAYDAFVAGLRYSLRKDGTIPPMCVIEEEFETSLDTSEYAEERLNLQVTKQAVLRNDLIVVTQDPADVPSKVLKFSDVVISSNLMGAVQFANKESAAGTLAEATSRLSTKGKPVEWKAFFADGSNETFIPPGGFSEYIKRD